MKNKKNISRKEAAKIALEVLSMIEKKIEDKTCKSSITRLVLNQALLFVSGENSVITF